MLYHRLNDNRRKIGYSSLLSGAEEPKEGLYAKKQTSGYPRTARYPLSEREIRSTLERLWLTYYNNELFKEGVISRDDYNQMQAKILTRTGSRTR